MLNVLCVYVCKHSFNIVYLIISLICKGVVSLICKCMTYNVIVFILTVRLLYNVKCCCPPFCCRCVFVCLMLGYLHPPGVAQRDSWLVTRLPPRPHLALCHATNITSRFPVVSHQRPCTLHHTSVLHTPANIVRNIVR